MSNETETKIPSTAAPVTFQPHALQYLRVWRSQNDPNVIERWLGWFTRGEANNSAFL